MSSRIVCRSKGKVGSKYTQSAARRTSGGDGIALGRGEPQSRMWAVVGVWGELRVMLWESKGTMVGRSVRYMWDGWQGWRDSARLEELSAITIVPT